MIGTSKWLSSTSTLSIPRLRSAASRCSTVSTDALSDDEAGLQLLSAAEVRDAGRNLDAAEIDALEADAVIGGCGLEGERDLLDRNEGRCRRKERFDEACAVPMTAIRLPAEPP